MTVSHTHPPLHAELQVDWRTFNILQEDGQLVDLVSYIGEPFPRETRGAAPRPRLSLDSLDDSVFQHEGTSDDDIAGEGPLVRVHLRSHEGVRSDKPFDIHPKQMVRTSLTNHSSLEPLACTPRSMSNSNLTRISKSSDTGGLYSQCLQFRQV